MAESVKVIVRCRPMNARELALKCKCCIKCDDIRNQVQIFRPEEKGKAPPKNFTFDGAYFTNSTTKQIYDDVGFALVDGVLEGYNGTVFAYGQTGCGKSFSMQGIPEPPEQRGIIPRAFEHIFETIDIADEDTKYLVQASYLEIYNEEIRDLLAKDPKQKLELRESPDSGVYTQGLSQHITKSISDCIKLMEKGWGNRATGATLMNADSSRSHSIFAIRIEMCTADEDCEEEKIKVGKLNLVDLAGSERQGKTGATGERLREATKINLSLSALGNVISALVDGKSKHIPYRDSKLTRLLQDSLGGNTKTMMVACISPADNNYEETMSTLRYANRAKNIKNKPKINEDPKDALLREYAEEIARLKMMLEGKIPISMEAVENPPAQQAQEHTSRSSDTDTSDTIKQEYEEKIAQLNKKYEDEKMSKLKLNEELEKLREGYSQKLETVESSADVSCSTQSKTTSDMAVSPVVGGIEAVLSIATMATSPINYTEEDELIVENKDRLSHSMDVQSISSLNTPIPVVEEPLDFTIQLTLQQAENLSAKQLGNMSLTPAQRRILGYEGPVTPSHVACLSLTAAQIVQLDMSAKQKEELSPYQDSVVSMLDEQCEKIASAQLNNYVALLQSTAPLTLSFEQAQSLTHEQLAHLVLSKEQAKETGVENAQDLTLEQISTLKLSPAQIAQLRLTDDQIADLSDDQYETVLDVRKLLERQELLCVLSDINLQSAPTVTLTSAQATQLDPDLVQQMQLTDVQTQIVREYKDCGTDAVEVSDLDQLPLLPHQVKQLNVAEACADSLTKQQTKKVMQSMETQTVIENVAIANINAIEECITKTVTLTAQEAATLTKEQVAKIQVAVSEIQTEKLGPNYSETLTLTPIELHQMGLTDEQKEKIKPKKVKRIEKHGKVVKKLKNQSAALIEMSVDRTTPEPHLVLTSEQATQVDGTVAPTKQQQETLHIESGRQLDGEDLGGVVLSRGQIAQLDLTSKELDTVLDPEQREQCLTTNLLNVKQDVLKRLNEVAPLEQVEINLSDDQVKTLTTKQLNNLRLTSEQCEALGLVPGQNISINEVSLITLNGEQIIQLKLSDQQITMFDQEQKAVMSTVSTRALQQLAYLKTNEEDGMLQLTRDQVELLTEQQLAKLILTDAQYAVLGIEKDVMLTREHVSQLSLSSAQVHELALTQPQVSFLNQDQKQVLADSEERVDKTLQLQDGVLPTNKTLTKQQQQQQQPSQQQQSEGTASAASAPAAGTAGKHLPKYIQLTTEQASFLTTEQLENLQLTEEQLAKLGITQEDVIDLVPTQLATLLFTTEQISALKLTPPQIKRMRPKSPPVVSDSTAKRSKVLNMPRVQEMPLTEEAIAITDKDQQEAIKMHQAALQKLQELQSNVVQGGSETDIKNKRKREIKDKMRRRKEAAENKKKKLRKAMEEGDDDGVIEELFSLQMEEVEVRNRKLSKIKDKYEEKMHEIQDLTSEFQTEREDYLESIRDQSQEAMLLHQILERVQPLLRRDCNYYNMDAIKADSKWNAETNEWFIPPVMITKTKVPSLTDMPPPKSSSNMLIQSSYYDAPEDLRIRHKLSTTENSDYFKSTRAQKLLQENKMLSNTNGNFPGSNRLFMEEEFLGGATTTSRPRNVLDPIDTSEKSKKKKSRGRSLYPL